MTDTPQLRWIEDGATRTARWRSERGAPPPAKVTVIDDRMTADEAYGLAAQGVALLWRGDFQNARQMLTALAKRVERRKKPKTGDGAPAAGPGSVPNVPTAFNLERQARAQRARTLGMLLVPIEADYTIPLRRAPDLREACTEAWGAPTEASVVSMRELLGVNGAHEWRRNGIEVQALGERIHPHYGVFSPIRGEYVELVARTPLPEALKDVSLAFDIGTGTGVLAALLAKRGVRRVVATDTDPRAIDCARENLKRLGIGRQVELAQVDLFPEGRAALVVCNPPWVPARPSSPLEHGIFDPDSRMLKAFLEGLAAHLVPGGEGWLVLSDFAEHLGLRTREELLGWIEAAGLQALGRHDAKPRHPKAKEREDALHRERAAEVTSLWRLAARA